MDISVFNGAITAARAAGDSVKLLIKSKSEIERNAITIELQQKILQLQNDIRTAAEAHAAIVDELKDAKKNLANSKNTATDFERYKLFAPYSGVTVYALKESMSNGEPAHYICYNCKENGKKSPLHRQEDARGFVSFACPTCKSSAPTGWRGSPFKFPPNGA